MHSSIDLIFICLFLFVSGGCSSTKLIERSDHSAMYSPAMGRTMSYSVYTPPDWQPNESLPLMVLLHGAADNHESFDRWSVGDELDQEINSGKLPRVIILK